MLLEAAQWSYGGETLMTARMLWKEREKKKLSFTLANNNLCFSSAVKGKSTICSSS